jgi:hypothetical protein
MKLSPTQEKTMQAAEEGYKAYCRHTGHVSFITGDRLPEWAQLSGDIKNAWFAAANQILALKTGEMK